MDKDKPPSTEVVKLPKERQRAPFVPLTGNPENGNWADWCEHMRGEEDEKVIPFSK